jgi:plastocyanin
MKHFHMLWLPVAVMLTHTAFSTSHTILVGQPTDQFSPQTLTIDLGDTVIFTWSSGSHTVVSDDGSWTTFPLNSAGSQMVILSSAGDYFYHCGVHGGPQTGMWGKIVVNDPASGLNEAQAVSDLFVSADRARGLLMVMTSSSKVTQVEMLSIDGRPLLSTGINPDTFAYIELGRLPKGPHIVVLRSAKAIEAARVFIN